MPVLDFCEIQIERAILLPVTCHMSHVHFPGLGGFSAFLDICELQVDRGDGKGFVALAFDTTPGYVDTQSFPAAPVKWTYQAIYRVGDSRVGQWSKPVSVTVGG